MNTSETTMNRFDFKPTQVTSDNLEKFFRGSGGHLFTPRDQEVLDMDYPRRATDRGLALEQAIQQRGSIRFILGYFRTEDEQAQFLQECLDVEIP